MEQNTNKFKDKSIIELIEMKKSLTNMNKFLSTTLVILLGLGIYISVTDVFNYMMILPLLLSPVIYFNMVNIKAINIEITKR
jgi:hypothetical protein